MNQSILLVAVFYVLIIIAGIFIYFSVKKYKSSRKISFEIVVNSIICLIALSSAVATYKANYQAYHSDKLYEMGMSYYQLGDYQNAAYYYQRAIKAGNIDALTNLGYMYGTGHGMPQDHNKALALYIEAGTKGDPLGMYNAGWVYMRHSKNYSAAAEWFKRAIAAQPTDNPDPCPFNDLGFLYANGLGVTKNAAKARQLFYLTFFAISENEDLFKQLGLNVTDIHNPQLTRTFIQYQYDQSTPNYSPELAATTKKLSQAIHNMCWNN